MELALTFGGCNSPTLYNMVARLLIELAALESGMDTRHSVQQLDDNCCTASVGSKILWRYLKSYRGLADELAEFQKIGILGSRIPDIIFEKFGHFWLKPEI